MAVEGDTITFRSGKNHRLYSKISAPRWIHFRQFEFLDRVGSDTWGWIVSPEVFTTDHSEVCDAFTHSPWAFLTA